MLDPYELLGLTPGASPDEVRRAYRRAARQLHPDAPGGGNAALFRLVTEAYERLTAPGGPPPPPTAPAPPPPPPPPPPKPEPEPEVRWDDLVGAAAAPAPTTAAPHPRPTRPTSASARPVTPRDGGAAVAGAISWFFSSARHAGTMVGDRFANTRFSAALLEASLVWFMAWIVPTEVLERFIPAVIGDGLGIAWLAWCGAAWLAAWRSVFANRRRLDLWKRLRGDDDA